MGAGGRPAQGQSPAFGHALSAGLAGAQATDSSLTTVPVLGSFRSSWQSVLASLEAGLDGIEKEGAGEEGDAPSNKTALAKPDPTGLPAALIRGGGASGILHQGRAEQGGSAEYPKKLSLSGVRVAIQGGQTGVLVSRRAASNAPESAHGAHSTESGMKTGLNAATAPHATDMDFAKAGNVPFATPAQAEAGQAAFKATPQPSGAALSTGLPVDIAPSSSQVHPPDAEVTATRAARTSIAGNHATVTTEVQNLSEKASDTAVQSGGRNATLEEGQDGTELVSCGEEAAPGRSLGHIEAPREMRAQGRSQTQPGSQGLEAVSAPIVNTDAEHGLSANGDAALQIGQVGPSAALNPIAAKPSLPSGGRSAKQDAQWVAHSPGAGGSAANGNTTPNSQISGAPANVSAMAHDPASAHGAAIAAGGLTGSSAHSSSGANATETFAALDGGSVPGKPAWIHAGAQRAEAGFQDPTLGWVGVRADMSGGGVHASLVPGSADAAVTLGGHLAGLNSYLAEQHTPVETLTLAAPENREAGLGAGQDMNQGMSQGFNQGESPHAGQGAGAESPTNSVPGVSSTSVAASQEVSAEIGRIDGKTYDAGTGSVHISVMA